MVEVEVKLGRDQMKWLQCVTCHFTCWASLCYCVCLTVCSRILRCATFYKKVSVVKQPVIIMTYGLELIPHRAPLVLLGAMGWDLTLSSLLPVDPSRSPWLSNPFIIKAPDLSLVLRTVLTTKAPCTCWCSLRRHIVSHGNKRPVFSLKYTCVQVGEVYALSSTFIHHDVTFPLGFSLRTESRVTWLSVYLVCVTQCLFTLQQVWHAPYQHLFILFICFF